MTFDGRTREYLRRFGGFSAQFRNPFITLLSFYYIEERSIKVTSSSVDSGFKEWLNKQQKIAEKVLKNINQTILEETGAAGLVHIAAQQIDLHFNQSGRSTAHLVLCPQRHDIAIARKLLSMHKMWRISAVDRENVFLMSGMPTRLVVSVVTADNNVVVKLVRHSGKTNTTEVTSMWDGQLPFEGMPPGEDPLREYIRAEIFGYELAGPDLEMHFLAFGKNPADEELVIFLSAFDSTSHSDDWIKEHKSKLKSGESFSCIPIDQLMNLVERGRIKPSTAVALGLLRDFRNQESTQTQSESGQASVIAQ